MIFGKEERLALILLAAVLLVVLASHLILSGTDRTLFAKPWANTSNEGELVYFEGEIAGAYATNTGGHLVIETDGPEIFFENGASCEDLFKEGVYINVTGTVSVYKGTTEIVVEDLKYIKFLS